MGYIGNHLSFSNGYAAMGKEAAGLGGSTFAFFTRNPRGGKAKEADPADASSLQVFLKEHGFGPLVAHAPYTMNLCSDKPSIRDFSLEMLQDDLSRMELLPDQYYNFHPGSHVGQGPETGIGMIADALNRSLFPEMRTVVLLETMSGKGSEIGGSFEELRQILDRVQDPSHVGICLDTCHVWDAGYDIVNDLDGVLTVFDRVLGLGLLKAVHLNDSKNPLGSRKDRHEKLGEGMIGSDALRRVVLHPVLRDLPFILETPNDTDGYIREIRTVTEWMHE